MAPHALRRLMCIPQLSLKRKDAHGSLQQDTDFSSDDKIKSKRRCSEQRRLGLAANQDNPAEDHSEPNTQDMPPPYSEPLNQGISNSATPHAVIEVCPHETLTPERFDRIIALPHFTTNKAKIDALTPTSPFHHRGHDKISKECQDSCKPLNVAENPGFVAKLKGFGTYATSPKPTSDSGSGLILSLHWEMKCLLPRPCYRTTNELQQFLEKTGIWLCAHKKMSDMDMVNAIHPIINSDGVPADPIDRYLAKEGSKDCQRCGTRIKVYVRTHGVEGRTCRVDTRRWIGKRGEALMVYRADGNEGMMTDSL